MNEKSFLKRNWKALAGIFTFAIVSLIIITQIQFKSPGEVWQESNPSVVEVETSGQPKELVQSTDIIQETSTSLVEEHTKLISSKLETDSISGNTSSTQSLVNPGSDGEHKRLSSTSSSSQGIASNGKTSLSSDSVNGDKTTLNTNYVGAAWNYVGERYQPLISQKVNYTRPMTVYVTVECTSIFEEGVECNDTSAWKYVPDDGMIVKRSQVQCYVGENVWVLSH